MKRSESQWPMILALVLCFPFGLYLMWRKSCRWHTAVKCAVSLLIAGVLCTIVLLPSPSQSNRTEVRLVGAEPSAKIYGPSVPVDYDLSSYPVDNSGVDILATVEPDPRTYVYASATKGSSYYHTEQCKYAFASSKRMTLYEAYILGYTTPCALCKPPRYDPATGQEIPFNNAG